MNWLLPIVSLLDLVRKVFTIKDPERTDRKPVDLNPPKDKS